MSVTIRNEDQLRSRYDHFLQSCLPNPQLECADCDFIADNRERLMWDCGSLVCCYCWRRREWIRDEAQEILEFIPSYQMVK